MKSLRIPFTMNCSNYTTEIESDLVNKRFVYSMQSKRCFAAFAKIKSNVSKFTPPDIYPNKLIYFQYSFTKSVSHPVVYNIDLKSAYAAVLFNSGFISKSTWDYLKTVDKEDRLASVGMLASKKNIFKFDSLGVIKNYELKVSPLENFFYIAVQSVYEIMDKLRAICAENFLFMWVDGIYFLPDKLTLEKCENFLRSIRMQYSEEVLNSWSVKYLGHGIKLSFIKEGSYTQFNLPAKQSHFQKILSDALSSMHTKSKL